MPNRHLRSVRPKAALRFSIFGAFAAAFVVFLAAVAVRLLLPAASAADVFKHQLESRYGREVRFGAARFTGLSTLRLETVEVAAGATFAAGTLGSADAVLVRAKLFPMLVGRVAITDAVVVRPRVTLERDAKGAPRWTVQPATGAATRPINVESLTVEGGAFDYVDRSSPTLSGRATAVNATCRQTDPQAPITCTASGQVAWRGVDGTVALAGAFDAGRDALELSRLDVGAGVRAQVRGDATVSRVGSADRQARLRLEWSGVDPSSFTAIAALPEGLAVRGETSGEFTLETSSFGYRARLTSDLTPGAVDWREVVAKAPGTRLLVDTALIRDGGRLLLRDLAVTLASIDLRGDGEITASGLSGRTAALRLRTADFDIEDFFSHLKVDVPDGVTLSGPVSAVVSVDGWTGGGSFVADVDAAKLEASFKSTFRKPAGAPLQLLASGRYATPVAVDLSSLRLDFGGIRLSGRGSYTPGKVRPTYTFRLKTNAFPLTAAAELTPMIRRYTPSGNGVLAMRVTRGDDGPSMSGDLTLISAGATIGGAALTRLSGTVRFTDDALSARSITGRLDGSPLHVGLRAHRYGERPFVEADINVDEFNLAHVLMPSRGGDAGQREPFDTSGVLRSGHVKHPAFTADDLTVEWNLASVGGDPSAVTGTASWRQGPGRLGDARALVDLSSAARLAFLPAALLQGVGEATGGALVLNGFIDAHFEAIDHDLSFRGGKAITEFVIQADGRRGEVRGAIGLPRGESLSAVLTARMAGSGLGGPAGAVFARRGIPIRLAVSGSAEEPAVRLDPKSLDAPVRAALRQASQGDSENAENQSDEKRKRRDAFFSDLLADPRK